MVRIFLAVIVVVSIVVFISSVMQYNELRKEQEALEQVRDELADERDEYQDLLDSKDDESYIIRMARKFWGLFFPDEEIFFNDRNS